MQLHYCEDIDNKYVWKCAYCYYLSSISKSTILNCINIWHFDVALTLWMMNCKTLNAARMISERSKHVCGPADEYFKLFRKAHSFYVEKKVLPWLVLTGPIEIDESKVNHKKYHC